MACHQACKTPKPYPNAPYSYEFNSYNCNALSNILQAKSHIYASTIGSCILVKVFKSSFTGIVDFKFVI